MDLLVIFGEMKFTNVSRMRIHDALLFQNFEQIIGHEGFHQEKVCAVLQTFFFYIQTGSHDNPHMRQRGDFTNGFDNIHAALFSEMHIHKQEIGVFFLNSSGDIGIYIQSNNLEPFHLEQSFKQRHHGNVIFGE